MKIIELHFEIILRGLFQANEDPRLLASNPKGGKRMNFGFRISWRMEEYFGRAMACALCVGLMMKIWGGRASIYRSLGSFLAVPKGDRIQLGN